MSPGDFKKERRHSDYFKAKSGPISVTTHQLERMRKGILRRSSRVAGKRSSTSKKVTWFKLNGDTKESPKAPTAKSSSVHNAKDIEGTNVARFLRTGGY